MTGVILKMHVSFNFFFPHRDQRVEKNNNDTRHIYARVITHFFLTSLTQYFRFFGNSELIDKKVPANRLATVAANPPVILPP